MNVSSDNLENKAAAKLIAQRCRIRRRPWTNDTLKSLLNRSGAAYFHARLEIQKFDPLALEPRDSFDSVPKNISAFITHDLGDDEALDKEDQKRIRQNFDLRPDFYSIDYVDRIVRFHEVEHTHHLEDFKLRRYIRAVSEADEYEFQMNLFLYDRYGHNKREFDLFSLWINLAG